MNTILGHKLGVHKNRERDVLLLVALRLAVITTLFAAAPIIQVITEAAFPLVRPLFYVIVFVYGLSLAYLLFYLFSPWWNRQAFLYVQMMGDVATATWLVYLTGGISSSFSFLYHIPILTASAFLYRRGALAAAAASALSYGTLLDMIYLHVIPPFREDYASVSETALYYYLSTNIAGFLLVAVLSGYLTERMRRQDIALTRTSQDLENLQVLHQDITESIASGLLTGNAEGRILFANPAAGRMLQRHLEDMVGAFVTDVLPGFPRDMLLQQDQRLPSAGEMFLAQGGCDRVLALSLTRLSGNPAEGNWVLVFEDITELRELEHRLRVKSRMAALGEMAAGLAHEIRNPLASIRGSAELLQGADCNAGERDRLLRVVVDETKRLNRSIEAFLRYVRGEDRPRAENINLRTHLEDVLSMLQRSNFFSASHRIETQMPHEDLCCHGDADGLRQVFWNLGINALKAMPQGGALRVRARRLPSAPMAEILFEDTGCGIPRHKMENVLLPFYSTFPGGMGLGLSISYNIVERHGGSLDIESEEGSGTAVRLRIPLADSVPMERRSSAEA
jgi:two-component system sensor histidine kinase PilS (NtrC family)